MSATADLTTALTNALPVVQAYGRACMADGDSLGIKSAVLAVDLIHGSQPDYAAEYIFKLLSGNSWFREGQPVIDELRRFL